jgi:UDP-GlcNAc:undecaprenyl-phosphate GlcNAc-1-phosphate transferase
VLEDEWWMMGGYGLQFATATALALLATPAVRAAAAHLGAIDVPGDRRVHRNRVPRLGGLAVVAAMLAALAIGVAVGGVKPLGELPQLLWLLAGTLSVVTIGAIDDVRSLGPWPKLAVEVVAGVMALAGGYGFSAVTNPFTGGYIALGVFGAPITLLWIVGITNAVNLIDGLDGLAAGVGVIAAVTLIVVAQMQERPEAGLLAATLAGALVGFLVYNFHPASIFLGDSGSLVVGFLLSVLSIQAQGKGSTIVVVLAPLLVLGLPIIETGLSMLRRFSAAGASGIFRADQEHIHHRLLRRGLSQRRAVLLLYAVSVLLSALAYLAIVIGGRGNALLVAGVVVAIYAAVRKLGYGVRS